MKIRHGFVSNSSSSSFVAIGYKVPKDNKSIIDCIYENNKDILDYESRDYHNLSWDSLKNEDKIDVINSSHIDINIYIDEESGWSGKDTNFVGVEIASTDMEFEEVDVSINKTLKDIDIDGDVRVLCSTRY